MFDYTRFYYLINLIDVVPHKFIEFDIPKSNGKLRHIKAPQGLFKQLQGELVPVLRKLLPESECAYAFVPGRTCADAVKLHTENHSDYYLKVDLKDFFPSISDQCLYDEFIKWYPFNKMPKWAVRKLIRCLVDENGYLTQGCKSSPYAANILLRSFDAIIGHKMKNMGIVYSRYADDLTFSSTKDMPVQFILDLVRIYLPDCCTINFDKVDYKRTCWSVKVLGLTCNKDGKYTVGQERKHLLKVIAHKWDTLSEEDKRHWRGVHSYCLSIEPEYFGQARFECMRYKEGMYNDKA